MFSQNNNEVCPDNSTPRSTNCVEETSVSSNTSNYTQDNIGSQYISGSVDIPNFYNGKKFLHHKVADYILKHYKVINLNGIPHIYTSAGIYTNDVSIIERLIVQLVPSVKIQGIKEVLNTIRILAPTRVETDYRFVAFSNGVLNIETLYFDNFNADKYILTSRLNVPYDCSVLSNSSPQLELVKTFLKDITCGNVELEILILQMCAYTLIRTVKFHKSFILRGEGSNGKSTLLHCLSCLLGKHCSHESLSQLSNIRFSSSNLYGCTANIVEDEAQPKNIDLALIKKIISGDTLSAERKGEQGFDFAPYATMILSMNDIVDFQSTDLGTLRRFIVIPFNATFSKENNNLNVDIAEQLCQPLCLQILAVMALSKFQQVLKFGHFSIPSNVELSTKSYFVESSPVMEYLSARTTPLRKQQTSTVYEDFEHWCNDNGIEVLAKSVFGKEMAHQGFRVERHLVDGERRRFYVAKDYVPGEDGTIPLENTALFSTSNELPTDLSVDSEVLEAFDTILNASTDNG